MFRNSPSHPRLSAWCLLIVVLYALAGSGCTETSESQPPETSSTAPVPSRIDGTDTVKLVVVLTVDQMRADYRERFADQYSGGLARLFNGGAVFTEAYHRHAVTDTSAGHATIATAVYPRRHGIVSNRWFDRSTRREVYSSEDPSAPVLEEAGGQGQPALALGRSPVNLRASTLGEWLKQSQPDSKVFSVSIKDRSAILTGGAAADSAYWYDGNDGDFVTSAYYIDRYPDWVRRFNERKLADSFRGKTWDLLMPESAYSRSRADAFQTEADGVRTTFPHTPGLVSAAFTTYYSAIRPTPFADELLFGFSEELIRNEALGQDDAVDLLWIGVSSSDDIGHWYGPFSREVQDYYLRLDQRIGTFLQRLDERVGPGGYLLILTSDHGVLPLVEELQQRGLPAGRIDKSGLVFAIDQEVQRLAAAEQVAAGPTPYLGGVYLNLARDAMTDEQVFGMRRKVADFIAGLAAVSDTYTLDELAAPSTPDRPFLKAYRRSFDPERSPDVLIRFEERHLATGPFGTSHGSPYAYDTHVPLVFYGGGIAGGTFDSEVAPVDIAPTVAGLLEISFPDDLDGRQIELSGPSR